MPNVPKALVVAWLSLIPLLATAQTNPLKLAASARFDLTASSEVGGLDEGTIAVGSGTIGRQDWRPAAEQARGYSVSFGLSRFATNSISISFKPRASGMVTLALMGPWEEAAKGLLYRQEVLWDSIDVRGASLVDARLDRFPIRSWHNGPVTMRLQVAAAMPVTIGLRARPAIPDGFSDMKRLVSRDTAAHRAARRFRKGANLGNYLEAPRGQNWGAGYTEIDFVHIKREGFDHVRLPIRWNDHAGPGPGFQLSDEIYAKADFLVTNALKSGLNVLVNIHHFDEFTDNPAAETNKFYALWRQIATHYAGQPDAVAFELLNEPKDAATTLVMNPIYAEVIRQVRRINPQRTVFVGPGKWNQVSELANLVLPDNDENLIVTLHCYEPFYFTHQGARWTGADTKVTGIQFPGPPATALVPDAALNLSRGVSNWIHRYNTLPADRNPSSPAAFRSAIQTAKEWSEHYGRPVHMGEFGCYVQADPASRARFYAEFRRALDEAGMGWAIWDWKAGFRYWDDRTQQPAEGMRDALFGSAAR